MTPRIRRLGIAFLLAFVAAASAAFAAPAAPTDPEPRDKLISLGTGPEGGAFRPIGEALCDAVNEDRSRTLVRCVPVGTAGSVFNLNAVAAGHLQAGIAQEDLLAGFDAKAPPPWRGRLRSVAVLHTSPIGIVARASAGIATLRDIAGKRVNLGNRGSGQHAIVGAILRAAGLGIEDLGSTAQLATSQFEKAFCEGQVDVVVEAVAHPSPLYERLMACGGHLVDIPADVAQTMSQANPFLQAMTLPAGTYVQQRADMHTLGMRNVLFVDRDLDPETVRRLTRSLTEHEQGLRSQQPLLASMPPPALPAPAVVPPHPGAARAFEADARGAP